MVMTMTQEMDKDCGSILQCGRDLGFDHGTLSDESCSVVATIVFHGHDHGTLSDESRSVVVTIVFHGCDYDLKR